MMSATNTTDLLLDIPNACTPGSGLCTGGRPRPEHLQAAARRGVRTVINLCPPAEAVDYDEAALVTKLGMHYVNIPVAGPADLTLENARLLAAAMAEAGPGHPVLLHCASGNRAGALLALKAHSIDLLPPAEALELGRRAGLTALEPFVRQLIGA
ncbi:MAG: protein tyrosine phosphatase family protein [bacterium]|nr:protein tyrosine phosphatase family protein [bacterium]